MKTDTWWRVTIDGKWVAIDLKTTADTVKPSELARKAYNYGYHRQAAENSFAFCGEPKKEGK